jgi:hypothetical protein
VKQPQAVRNSAVARGGVPDLHWGGLHGITTAGIINSLPIFVNMIDFTTIIVSLPSPTYGIVDDGEVLLEGRRSSKTDS